MSDAIASSSSAWPSLLQTAGPSADPQGFPLQTTGSPSPRRALVLRAHHLKDLIRNLDIAVYAELSAIYYMEYAPAHVSRFSGPQSADADPRCAV